MTEARFRMLNCSIVMTNKVLSGKHDRVMKMPMISVPV
jgi:hypothetical protein